MLDEKIVGYCGLYCGSCIIYRAAYDDLQGITKLLAEVLGVAPEDIKCEGCRSLKSIWGSECFFKICALEHGVELCYECPNYPCPQLFKFANSTEYRKTIFENNLRIQEIGLEEWLKEQDEKWRCPVCKNKIAFYNVKCPHCHSVLR